MDTKVQMLKKLNLFAIAKYRKLEYFLYLTAVIVIIGVYLYYNRQITKKKKEITDMTNTLDKIPMQMHGINGVDQMYQYRLRDYYIASSYNSCCPGQFLDDYVSLEAIANVLKKGVRLVDLEIYSYGGRAVVAASPSPSYDFKGTYNCLPLNEVFSTINGYAFGGEVPNPNDPLFIHLRVKSNNLDVYKQLSKSLSGNFTNLLSQGNPEYSNESNGENLTAKPLIDFIKKTIIICDNRNNNFRNTPLEELINITSSSQFLRGLRNYNVQYTPDMGQLITYNKKNMSLVMPDLSSLNKNQNAALQQKYGCQMTLMNYQNLDTNLVYYLKFFASTAFVLKPKALRYVPVAIPPPAKQDVAVSFAPRSIIMPQFTANI
jgi:hypothetical protein